MACASCVHGVTSFCAIVCDRDELLQWLKDHNVILSEVICPTCNRVCTLNSDLVYRCDAAIQGNHKRGRMKCTFSRSLRKNSWFDRSALSIESICLLAMYWLCIPMPSPLQKFISEELNMGESTVVDWTNFCRDVCIKWCERTNQKLGGAGKVVEIDTVNFCSQEKGKRKRDYGETSAQNSQWVFGGYERGTKRLFLLCIKDRTADTIVKALKESVTVMSNGWKGFKGLDKEGYTHLTVNHSRHFKDPHTQGITWIWRDVRSSIPTYGIKCKHFEGYLCEYLWKRAYPDHIARLHYFFKEVIAVTFNPLEAIPWSYVRHEDTTASMDGEAVAPIEGNDVTTNRHENVTSERVEGEDENIVKKEMEYDDDHKEQCYSESGDQHEEESEAEAS